MGPRKRCVPSGVRLTWGTFVASLGVVAALAMPGVAVAGAAPNCPPGPTPEAGATRVMITGDSLTDGTQGDYTWRYFFWKHLVEQGVPIDLVGPWNDLLGGCDYADPAFDKDHFARGGVRLAQYLQPAAWAPEASSLIAWAVAAQQPDVVVLFAGHNDFLVGGATPAQVIAGMKTYIDEVRSVQPSATVVIGELADFPLSSSTYRAAAAQTNQMLVDAAPGWSTLQSPVVLAPTRKYFPVDGNRYDGIHPDANGANQLAAAFASVFAAIGMGTPFAEPLPVLPVGPRQPATLTASSQPDGASAKLTWTLPPGADGFVAEARDLTVAGGWRQVARSVGGATATVVPDLVAGHSYEFRGHAAKGVAVAYDIWSNTATTTMTHSPFPSSSASPSPSSVTPSSLTRPARPIVYPGMYAAGVWWRAVTGATSYIVRWRAASTGAVASRAVSELTTVVAGLVAGEAYSFTVRPVRAGEVGPASDAQSVRIFGLIPAAPQGVSVGVAKTGRVVVRWQPVAHATRYRVLARAPHGRWVSWGSTTGRRLTGPRLREGARRIVRVQSWHQLVPGPVSAGVRVVHRTR